MQWRCWWVKLELVYSAVMSDVHDEHLLDQVSSQLLC